MFQKKLDMYCHPLLASVVTLVLFSHHVSGQLQGNGNFMGQYAALPWSLAWLNPSYTGFYGGIGNVGQLNSDSSYLSGSGGQIGGGGGYNYATGIYGGSSSIRATSFLFIVPVILVLRFL